MAAALACLWAVALLGCSEATTVVARDAPEPHDGATPVEGGAPGADAARGHDSGPRVAADCGGRPCACDNGLDDDGDELIDGLDPECTGRLDDDEESFGTGTAGPPAAGACQDCFFDDDMDPADDGCVYAAECLLGQGTTSEGTCGDCSLSAQCVNSCRPRTPNGCDCFGCCEVTRNDASVVTVVLGEGCSVKKVDDVTLCPRCVQHPTCRNDCGVCELCPGKKRKDLPQSCRGMPGDGAPGFSCDEGEQVCDENAPCPPDFYCQLGCCLPIPQ